MPAPPAHIVRELFNHWADQPAQQRLAVFAARKIRGLSWNGAAPDPADIVNTVNMKVLLGELNWPASVPYMQMMFVNVRGEVYKQNTRADQRLVDRVDLSADGTMANAMAAPAMQERAEIAKQKLMRFLPLLKSEDPQLFVFALEIMDQNYGERRDHKRIASSLGISVLESYGLARRLVERAHAFDTGVSMPVKKVETKEAE